MSQATSRFEEIVMPHLDAAYNLARWLVKDQHAAEDVVQDAYLRAFRYFNSFRGDDARPWLLGIVRNTCYSWLQNKKQSPEQVEFDDAVEMDESAEITIAIGRSESPETLLVRKADRTLVNAAIQALPTAFREVIILREIEEMPYDSIATIMHIPIGTVMSRLSRARSMLRAALEAMQPTSGHHHAT
jgi:RNA polymerase sigma-70 factor (ECF subfamily)